MKKIKIITTASSLAAFGGGTVVATTSCSSKTNIDDLNWVKRDKYYSSKSEGIWEQIKLDNEGLFDWLNYAPIDPYISVNGTDIAISITASDGSDYKGEVKWNATVVENKIVFDDGEYLLADNIPAEKFKTFYQEYGTSYYLSQTYNLKTGGTLTIDFGDETDTSYFLYGCSGLKSVDLGGLQHNTTIESYFLGNCSSLTSVDLSPFKQVTAIDEYFLSGCSSLASLELLPFLKKVQKVNDGFLFCCNSLTELNLDDISPNIFEKGEYHSDSFATDYAEAPMYKKGILLTAKNRDEIIEKFPESSYEYCYRKWR